MDNSKFIRFAGFVGMDAALFVLSAVFASTILAGESFSWSRNALSDLGVSQVQNVANLFNYSLILGGIVNFIFAVGFVKAYAKNALFYVGGIVLILGGGSLSPRRRDHRSPRHSSRMRLDGILCLLPVSICSGWLCIP